jgi:hypothetical protein
MEASEAKPASRRSRLWARVSDPDKWPRRWWFPPLSRQDVVPYMSKATQQNYRTTVQQAHEKFSETVRLAMLSLLGFALFCLLITFSVPDGSLLVADPTIKMPFADVQVSFQSFLILAPVLLIVITLYLHIFYGYWLDLERDYQHLTRSHDASEPSIERLPTLFSLDHPVPRLLTAFIFYWLVPLVLLTITWKAAAPVEWGLPLIIITGVVTAMLVFLRIRRRSASQRQWIRHRLHWGVMVLIVLIVGYIAALTFKVIVQSSGKPTKTENVLVPVPRRAAGENTPIIRNSPNDQFVRSPALEVVPQWLQRPLDIFRMGLKGKWLAQISLRGANADLVNFEGAILAGADLQGANLRDANLLGANLQAAKLWDANFQGANLQAAVFQHADLHGADFQDTKGPGAKSQGADFRGANLRGAQFGAAWLPGAKFSGAKLQGADFQRADLRGAQLQGADLRGVKNLTVQQIESAHTDERTLLPEYLKRPPP